MTLPPILVTGGTGTLGRQVAARLREAGRDVRILSRRTGDAQATRNLVQAATKAATKAAESQPHLVYISIVGVDRFPRGYFKAKLAAERVVAESGLPWTTLRATQFYELIAKGATRLAELAQHEPSGRVPDLAGPQVLSFADLIRTYLRVTGLRPRPVLPVWTPGIGPIRAGALYPLPGTPATLGQRTWPDFLTVNYSSLRVT
jgi:uncharacterized protein YbjT (DUF2867 family)